MSVRLDAEALRALDEVAGSRLSRSEAIRQALIETAKRRRARHSLAAEARRLGEDTDDRAEKQEIAVLMEALGDPW